MFCKHEYKVDKVYPVIGNPGSNWYMVKCKKCGNAKAVSAAKKDALVGQSIFDIATPEAVPQECYKMDDRGYIVGVWLTDDEYSPSGYGWYWDLLYRNGNYLEYIDGGLYWGYSDAKALADDLCDGQYIDEQTYHILIYNDML